MKQKMKHKDKKSKSTLLESTTSQKLITSIKPSEKIF